MQGSEFEEEVYMLGADAESVFYDYIDPSVKSFETKQKAELALGKNMRPGNRRIFKVELTITEAE